MNNPAIKQTPEITITEGDIFLGDINLSDITTKIKIKQEDGQTFLKVTIPVVINCCSLRTEVQY